LQNFGKVENNINSYIDLYVSKSKLLQTCNIFAQFHFFGRVSILLRNCIVLAKIEIEPGKPWKEQRAVLITQHLSFFSPMSRSPTGRRNWSTAQDTKLWRLYNEGRVDYTNNSADYLWQITQTHFPEFTSSRERAIKRLRDKKHIRHLQLLQLGRRGAEVEEGKICVF